MKNQENLNLYAEITQMLELPGKDFKATVIKMIQK